MSKKTLMSAGPLTASILFATGLLGFGLAHFYPSRLGFSTGCILLAVGIGLSGFINFRIAATRFIIAAMTLLVQETSTYGDIVAGVSIVSGIFGIFWTLGECLFRDALKILR